MPQPKAPRPKFKLSYSEKRDICVCPHRYDLTSVQKVPQDFDIRRLLLPNVLDQGLTDWVELRFKGKLQDIIVEGYRKYVAGLSYIKWKSKTDKQECEAMALVYATTLDAAMRKADLLTEDAQTQVRMEVDVPLQGGEKIRLTGRLDLLYIERLHIYDLKITKSKQWLDKSQLVYYDFGISQMLGKKIKKCGFLAPLMNPCVQEIPFVGKSDWDQLFKELDFAIATMQAGVYPDLGDYSKDCFMCFMKTSCKRYSFAGPAYVNLVKGQR